MAVTVPEPGSVGVLVVVIQVLWRRKGAKK